MNDTEILEIYTAVRQEVANAQTTDRQNLRIAGTHLLETVVPELEHYSGLLHQAGAYAEVVTNENDLITSFELGLTRGENSPKKTLRISCSNPWEKIKVVILNSEDVTWYHPIQLDENQISQWIAKLIRSLEPAPVGQEQDNKESVETPPSRPSFQPVRPVSRRRVTGL